MRESTSKIVGVLNFIGGVSGLLAIASIAVFGGEMKRQVTVNTDRLTRLEMMGSPALIAHEKMDDERNNEQNRRLNVDEDAIKQLSDFKADIRADLRGISIQIEVLIQQVKALQAAKGP